MPWILLLRLSMAECPNFSESRQVFFGDLHVHTHLSLDASAQGTRITPDEAYAFAQGEPLVIRGGSVQIDPLHFVALTDHSEFLGEQALCTDPESERYKHPLCWLHRRHENLAFLLFHMQLARPWFGDPNVKEVPRKNLCGRADIHCRLAAIEPWQNIQSDAHNANKNCQFTTFVGYEWTGSPRTTNLHRNVLFSDLDVPKRPISYFEAPTPQKLWHALAEECVPEDDCEVITIPHNANLGGGQMFLPYDNTAREGLVDYAEWRAKYEPLVEIFQHKGSSECGPMSSDEQCAFEQLPYGNLTADIFGKIAGGEPNPADSVRWALGEGLAYAEAGLSNPYQYGLVASTDTHLGTPGLTSESDFIGHGGLGKTKDAPIVDNVWFNPGGLTGVWAEENTRSSIFSALQRREAFGTSGPRIAIRMFGAEDFPEDICSNKDRAEFGYFFGAPMGGELSEIDSPVFLVEARQDQTPLVELQIVKIWRDGDEPREKVISIHSDTQESDMCIRWQDPDYDPSKWVAYYSRVLEVPTHRWTALRCSAISCSETPRHACCGDLPPRQVQERAWSSPIWIAPHDQ
ncbi:MAG: DUF3604 domain-containing protein [Myxococcota bacterium]